MGGSLGLTAIIGGLLLAAVLLFAVLRNRQRSAGARQRTEEATKELYARVDQQDKISDPDPAKY